MKDIKKDAQGCGLCPKCGIRITRPLNSKFRIEESHEGTICRKCKNKQQSEGDENHDRRTEPRHDHEIVTTSLEGYMAQVEKEAPKPATPHNPTPVELAAFKEFCKKTCHGDCEMCKVAAQYDVPQYELKSGTTCDACGQEIPEGKSAHATTSGTIVNGAFQMDEEKWLMVVCENCGEQIQYISGSLETALEAIDK